MVKGTAIVVTHNSASCVERCLEALIEQSGWEVLLIDNTSQDDTVARASRYAQQARIFRSSVNTGFAGGVNQGVKLATGDILVLVNPDAIVAPGTLDKLADALSAPNTGASGGLLVLEGGKLQIGNIVRRFPTVGSALAELLLLNNIWYRNPWNRSYRYLDMDYSRAQSVENPAGASLAFRRAAWESVKGFDEGFYPVWFEDVDFCRCLRDAGWDIVYEPGAILDHVGAHSVGQLSFYNHQLFWYRNLLRYFKKHHSWLQCCLLRAGIVSGLMLRAMLSLIKPSKDTRWGMFRDYARAAWRCGIRPAKAEGPSPHVAVCTAIEVVEARLA
jgi:GT2 family glycosyltransferase